MFNVIMFNLKFSIEYAYKKYTVREQELIMQ